MLTKLIVGNFKAFGPAQEIPIRPITLIYGANSSGKSSIIHSLVLAKHALDTGDFDAHRTDVGGDSVDLGGFCQYIHGRDTARCVEWAVSLNTSRFGGRLRGAFGDASTISAKIEIGLSPVPKTELVPAYNIHERKVVLIPHKSDENVAAGELGVQTLTISLDDAPILRMSKRGLGFALDTIDLQSSAFSKAFKKVEDYRLAAARRDRGPTPNLSAVLGDMIPRMIAVGPGALPDSLALLSDAEKEAASLAGGRLLQGVSSSPVRYSSGISKAIKAKFPRGMTPSGKYHMVEAIQECLEIIGDFIAATGTMLRKELALLRYLGPLRSYPPRHQAFSPHHDANWHAGGGYAWDVLRTDDLVRWLVNKWLSAPERLQTPYRIALRELVGTDLLQDILNGWLQQMTPDHLRTDLASQHESEDQVDPCVFLDPEAEVSKLVSTIRTSSVGKINDLIMIDQRSNTVVSHRDVGIGISQVLPVLVTAYASKHELIAIEQPELHLHPALQADLGDVFIQSALGDSKNTLLIESHSEHLLLRIMRRMRETNSKELPEGVPEVTPKDVCILFVQPKGSASVVRQLELDAEGQLLDAWPGGFFEEGFRERFA
ncbi:MAG: DUF3696 domain-containing protein [Candidatus Brocadiia bacterium]